MKKLGVILLAMVFIFGLAAQASADFRDDLVVGDFTGEGITTIDFNSLDYGVLIEEQSGVVFSGGLYKDTFWNNIVLNIGLTACNFDPWVFWTLTQGSVITATFVDEDGAVKPVRRVGFKVLSPLEPPGGVSVIALKDGQAVGTVYLDPIVDWYRGDDMLFVGIENDEGIDAIEISAVDGMFYGLQNALFIDDFKFGGTPDTGPEIKYVDVHIKPPDCIGAPINVKSQGVTPVVIAGSEDFDVTMINLDSIELEGATPVRSAVEDASLCNEVEGDGDLDLALKFNTQDLINGIRASLGEGETLQDGHSVPLHLTGNLYDLTPIREKENSVRVTVLVKGKQDQENKGKGKNK